MTDRFEPRLTDWNFAARERDLFAACQKIPTWRLANQSRRLLADVVKQASDLIPTPTAETYAELPADDARQLASTQLGALLVRSTGSVLMLVSTGYEREALGPARIGVEALIRARQANDDPSGGAARSILQGRRPGSLKSAAQRYGEEAEIRFLDRFAHADVLGLLAIGVRRNQDGPAVEMDLELRPQRGVMRPASQLLTTARTATMFCALLAEVFTRPVQIPAWISGQLLHYRDNPLPEVL